MIKTTPIHLIFLAFVSMFIACSGGDPKNKSENTAEPVYGNMDSLETRLVNTMDEIDKNLDLIREKQGLISSSGELQSPDKKDQILESISLINTLLEDNKRKIEELTKISAALGKEKVALVRIAEQAKQRIQKQDQEILRLKQDLAMEEFKVADLNVKMDELQVNNELLQSEKEALQLANNEFDKDLNKAFYTYGTLEQLTEKEIVEKKGVLSRKSTLSNKFNQNRSYFSDLDIRHINSVPYRGKNAKLLSMHPEGSYIFKENGTEYGSLEITDKVAFWSISRFLVIQVK